MTVSDQVTEVGVKYLAEVGAEKVPAGYKQTEVGVIPEDWDIKTYRMCLCSYLSPLIHELIYLL